MSWPSHFHAEARAAARATPFADGAQADDAHGLAVQVDAGDLAPVPFTAAAVDEGHLAGHAQHEGQGVVGHGLAVGAHGAGDLDAAGLAGGKVDIVQAHAVLGDGPQTGRGGQHRGIDGVHAHDQAVAVGQFFAHPVGGEDAAGIVAHDVQPRIAEDVEEFGIVLAEGSRGGEDFHDGAPCRERCAGGRPGEEPFMPLCALCGPAVLRGGRGLRPEPSPAGGFVNVGRGRGQVPFSFALRASARVQCAKKMQRGD